MIRFKVFVLSFLFLLNSVHSMKGKASGRRVVRILSIDGEGLRNIIPLTVLNGIEECLTPHASLSDCFDIITGVSTGGVVSLGLTLGKSPREILDLYRTQASRIFSKSSPEVDFKYDSVSMKQIFQEFFEDKWLSDCTPTAVIPVYDLGTKNRYVFNSAIAKERPSNDFFVTDIAVATSADQNFFPPATIVDKTKFAKRIFVDGRYYDIDPVSEAIREANERYSDCDFYILSLGTGEVPRRYGDLLSRDGDIIWSHAVMQEILTQQHDSQRVNLKVLKQNMLFQRREVHYHRVQLPISENLATIDEIGNINPLIYAGLALLSQANEFFPIETRTEIVKDLLGMKSEHPRLPDQYRIIRRTIHNLASADVLKSFIPSSRLGSDLNYTEELDAIFREGSNTITITSQSAVVGGMGGIGKSTLALNYAYTRKDFYDCVFWIYSIDDTNLTEGYKEVLRRLGVSCSESEELDAILKKVEEELREKRYLLIYDNVPDNAFLNGKIPVGKGHVLITSRCQSSGWKNPVIRMSVFQPSKAVDYLFKSMNINATDGAQLIRTPQLETDAVELSELLGYLPLALSHASAYIKYARKEGEDYIFKDYARDFSDESLILLDKQYSKAQGEENVDYHHLLAKTLAVAQKRISKFSKLCGTILDYCAYLDRNNILKEFFDEFIRTKQREVGESRIIRPFVDLATFSLITPISDGSFSIHGLVQMALLDKQTSQEKQQNIREVSRILSDKVKSLYVTDKNSYDRVLKYLLNVSALLKISENLSVTFSSNDDILLAEKVLYYMARFGIDFSSKDKKLAAPMRRLFSVNESFEQMFKTLQRGAEEGFIDAKEKLGLFYLMDIRSMKRNEDKAKALLTEVYEHKYGVALSEDQNFDVLIGRIMIALLESRVSTPLSDEQRSYLRRYGLEYFKAFLEGGTSAVENLADSHPYRPFHGTGIVVRSRKSEDVLKGSMHGRVETAVRLFDDGDIEGVIETICDSTPRGMQVSEEFRMLLDMERDEQNRKNILDLDAALQSSCVTKINSAMRSIVRYLRSKMDQHLDTIG